MLKKKTIIMALIITTILLCTSITSATDNTTTTPEKISKTNTQQTPTTTTNTQQDTTTQKEVKKINKENKTTKKDSYAVTVNSKTITPGTTTLTATVKNNNYYSSVNSGTVYFYVDYILVASSTPNYGTATATYTFNKEGTYDYFAEYYNYGSSYYSNSAKIKVEKNSPEIVKLDMPTKTNTDTTIKVVARVTKDEKRVNGGKLKITANWKTIYENPNIQQGLGAVYYKTPSNPGTYTIVAQYLKNGKIITQDKKTVTVNSKQLKTKLTLNNIATAYKGNTITISGKLLDQTGKIIKNTPITLNINGKQYTVKTDYNGAYIYKYKTTTSGTNKVTVSYAGSTNYVKTSTQKTFTVRDLKVVTMYMRSPTSLWPVKYINGDPFVVHYNNNDGQYDRGAYAEIDERGMDTPPVNKLVKATFYFKNNKGKIVTRTGYPDYYTIIKASLVKGYTPYKVDIYYTKMTQQEIDSNWYWY